MEGDLDARDLGPGEELVDQVPLDRPVAGAVAAEEDHAVAGPPLAVVVAPAAVAIERDQGVEPAGAVEVRPLVGEAQVALDDPAADGLEVHRSRVPRQVRGEPVGEVALELGTGLGRHHPVVEHAVLERHADGVAEPEGPAVDHRHVGRDVVAGEQRHPEVAGGELPVVLGARGEHPARHPHAAQVVDRLAEHREALGRQAVGPRVEALGLGHQELVVDPAVPRVEAVGVAVLGGDEEPLRALDAREVLHPPGVAFDDRQGRAS